MKQCLLLSGILVVLFSCNNDSPVRGSYQNRTFWAQDFGTNPASDFYQVNAELLATGTYCRVYADKNLIIDPETAAGIADTYDNDIYWKITDVFSKKNFQISSALAGKKDFTNIMELANWLANGARADGKLTILLLDIRDDYNGGGGFVGGYFWAGNFFSNVTYSNRCDMIYIDAYPSKPGSLESNTTLAHEMQHLINFITSYFFREVGKETYFMDTWIDEGLSESSGWIYSGKHPDDRWRWFNEETEAFSGYKGLIGEGNNFFVWGNREDENPDANLDDYATVYLFFQWLRLQSGSTAIFTDIISSPPLDYDYKALTDAAAGIDPGFNDWGTLLKTWMAANYINAGGTSILGYRDDPILGQVKAKTTSKTGTSISLYQGEGVYSIINAIVNPTPTGSIEYAGLTTTLSDSGPFTSGALLTYNTATDKTKDEYGIDIGTTETGDITGVSSSKGIIPANQPRLASRPLRPYSISAGDMLRRNRHKGERFSLDLSALRNEYATDD